MVDDVIHLAAVNALAIAALAAFIAQHAPSTPAICQAAKIALENPGSEIHVYGRVNIAYDGEAVLLSCGLSLPRSRILYINKTEGLLKIGSTADGRLYIG